MLELNESNFLSTIETDKPVVVDFFTTWCPPCRAMLPTYKEWSETYAEKATFAKLDIDDAREISVKYRIHAVPTVVVFKEGKETARWQGIPKEKELIAAIS